MYNHIYLAMVKSGIAIELEEEEMVTLEGTITDDPTKSFGRKTKYLLTRPELLFFVDEVGSNTSQKKDGNVGGQTFVVHHSQRALLRSSHADCHFTVLGFTNGRGAPVCCVIIIAGKEITAKHRMGLQPWVDYIGDPAVNLTENSNGVDKYYPYGPTCFPYGKEVETYVTCSENGSITSEILRDALKHIDSKLTFDRTEGTPFLLLDGHGSRFQLPFLDYINTEENKWTVCIGVPYGTHIWQVGDSSQQNGAFKQALTVRKEEVMRKKAEMQLGSVNIERHDIVGIVHYAWNHSFSRIESNKKATAERGWNPLTYTLLDCPELNNEKENDPIKHANDLCLIAGQRTADPNILNLETGLSGTMMDKIISHKVRQQALDKARAENAAEIVRQRKEKFENCCKMTAGIAFNSGNVNLSDGEVRNRVLSELQKKKDKELATQSKRVDAEAALADKVIAIRAKNKDPAQWDKKDLTTMVSWFKRPGDKALPGNKLQLLRRYTLTCNRIEEDRSTLKHGESPVLTDGVDENIELPPLPVPVAADETPELPQLP
jgi:hypothetical protein